MTGKHTPGPWTLYKCCDVWRLTSPSVAEILTSHYVGDYIDGDHEGAIGDEANARLIAAAPDLLEACRKLLDGYCVDFMDDEEADRVRVHAQAAIAKAEGRE